MTQLYWLIWRSFKDMRRNCADIILRFSFLMVRFQYLEEIKNTIEVAHTFPQKFSASPSTKLDWSYTYTQWRFVQNIKIFQWESWNIFFNNISSASLFPTQVPFSPEHFVIVHRSFDLHTVHWYNAGADSENDSEHAGTDVPHHHWGCLHLLL